MVKLIKQNLPFLLLILLVLSYTFWNSWKIFYQQDEWHVLGSYFTYFSILDLFKELTPLGIILGEDRPFSIFAGYLLLFTFPYNTLPVALYSLFFHLANTLVVYFLANKLFKTKIISSIAAIFFTTCAVSSNTVTWYSTSIGTLPSVFLILLGILAFYQGIEKNSAKLFLFSFLLLYLSLFFKEVGYFLFLVLPFIYSIYKVKDWKNIVTKFWYYYLVFITITVYRLIQLNSYSQESSIFIQTSSQNFIFTLLFRALLYPLSAFSLIFIPPDVFISFAKFFTNSYYPFFPSEHYNLIVQSSVLEFLSVILSFILLLLIFLFLTKFSSQIRKNIICVIILSVTSYLPYIILGKNYAYLDARYFYLGGAFSGMLLGFLAHSLINLSKKRPYKIVILTLVVIYIFANIQISKKSIEELSSISSERLGILKALKDRKKTLGEKSIFLVNGSREYYLDKGNNIPFQQGFGYTLLVWYAKENPYNKDLLTRNFLWDLGSQGYTMSGNIAFGYFWDRDKFNQAIKNNNLTKEQIVEVFYDSNSRQVLIKNE